MGQVSATSHSSSPRRLHDMDTTTFQIRTVDAVAIANARQAATTSMAPPWNTSPRAAVNHFAAV